GASVVDDLGRRRDVALIRTRTNPDDVACVDEEAYLFPQRWPSRVGQGRVPIQGGSSGDYRSTPLRRPTLFRRSKIVSPNQTNGGSGWSRSAFARNARKRGARWCSSWATWSAATGWKRLQWIWT